MNEINVNYCPTCYAYLGSFGLKQLEFYEFVCAHYASNIHVLSKQGPKGHGENMIKFLEDKGYITTTEISERDLLVKPMGCHVEKESFSFCINRKNHKL